MCPHCHEYTQTWKWINVNERLPQKGECVLICEDSSIEMAMYQQYDNETWTPFYGDHSIKNVTHWMPLPPPPSRLVYCDEISEIPSDVLANVKPLASQGMLKCSTHPQN